jgi:hypothetical protein
MSIVILRWNPEISSYRMGDFKRAIEEAKATQNYMLNWSVWEHEKVHCGDRFFMLRVGKGKTGVVMSGRVVSEPYHDEDWSGKGRMIYYVNIRPDFFVDTERGKHLAITDLEEAFPNYVWKEGHSGMVLSDSLGTKLEWLWLDFLYNNFGGSKESNFASNLYETDGECVEKTYHHSIVAPLQIDLAKKRGAACEICGYDYEKVFDLSSLNYGSIQNIYYFFPSKRQGKSVRTNFHCICANCRNIYNDICSDTNDGELLPFESLAKIKRK